MGEPAVLAPQQSLTLPQSSVASSVPVQSSVQLQSPVAPQTVLTQTTPFPQGGTASPAAPLGAGSFYGLPPLASGISQQLPVASGAGSFVATPQIAASAMQGGSFVATHPLPGTQQLPHTGAAASTTAGTGIVA